MKSILIVSHSNPGPVLMMEGWFRYYGSGEVKVSSATLIKAGPDVRASSVMADAMIDISGLSPLEIGETDPSEFDFVIIASEGVESELQMPKGPTRVILNPFPEPFMQEGTEEEMVQLYANLRDQIEDFSFDFIHFNIRPLFPPDMENLFIDSY